MTEPTVVAPAAPAETTPPPPARPARRLPSGWLGVSAITAVVAVSWLPLLTAPYGDNHLGRVQGRYALQLRNLQELGFADSRFGADWSPYSETPYAHHPPLPNLLSWLFGMLPGDGAWQVRLGPYLLALLALPAAAALLRGFGLRWPPTLVAVGLMAVTGYFWFYGVLMFDIGTILALSAAVVHLRRHPQPQPWLVAGACVAAVLATLGSWPGVAFAAGLGIWLLMARRLDRVTVLVGASMVIGVAASLGYAFGVHGLDALADQTELRTAGGSFTATEFVNRQLRWLSDLLPAWYLLLLPFGVFAGLADRRTRFFTAMSAVLAAGWVLVFNNGAFVHDYWAFLVLVPGLVGMGALLDQLAGRLPAFVSALAGIGLAAGFAVMVFGPAGQDYVYRPADAGRLVAEHPPAAGQQYAWHDGLPAPRWLAYYWNLPPREATAGALAERAGPGDLVVVNMDRPPDGWAELRITPLAQEGRYALFLVADLRLMALE
jgi:hypothetical protein